MLKRLWWLAGAILLGAIGSGFWDLFLKHAAIWAFAKIFSGATFGFTRLRDMPYTNAAKGYRELSSLTLLLLVAFAPIVAYFTEQVRHPIYNLFGLKDLERMSPSDANERVARFVRGGTFMMGIVSVILALQMYQLVFSNSLIAHFNQSLAICAPVLKDSAEKKFRQRFAQMKNKPNYESIMADLQTVANENKLELPVNDKWY